MFTLHTLALDARMDMSGGLKGKVLAREHVWLLKRLFALSS